MSIERVILTPDQAISMLPDGDTIHTFTNPAGMLLGADWSRDQIIAAIRKSTHIELTGPKATNMGHRFVMQHEGRAVYVKSNPVDETL